MVGPDTPQIQRNEGLVDGVIERIQRCAKFSELKVCVYDEINKFGLIMEATNEGIFNRKLWKEINKEKIIQMVKMFLRKHL